MLFLRPIVCFFLLPFPGLPLPVLPSPAAQAGWEDFGHPGFSLLCGSPSLSAHGSNIDLAGPDGT